MVICRAWQAELGEPVRKGGGQREGHGGGEGAGFWMEREACSSSSPTFLVPADQSPESGSCFRSRATSLRSISSLPAPESKTDGQTDVEHSCSPVRQKRACMGGAANSRVPPWQVRALVFPDAMLPAPWAH